MSSDIGTRIRDLRVAKGMTQTALSGNGISSGYMSLIESGQRTPSDKMVREIARRLGVPAEELLEVHAEPTRTNDEARVDVNFARMSLANSNPTEAVRIIERLELDDLDNLTANEAATVYSDALMQTGDIVGAVGVLRALVDRNRRESAWVALARAATSLSVFLYEAGDVNAAVDVGSQCLSDIDQAGLAGSDEHIRLGATYMFSLFARGDIISATEVVQRLIKVADRVGTNRARGSIYWNAAIVAQERGALDEAIRLTDRAAALLSEDEDGNDLPRLRLHYAWLLLNSDYPHAVEAITQLDRAEAHQSMRNSKLDQGVIATLRGRAYLVRGQHDDAVEQAANALQLLGPSEHMARVEALILLGDVGAARFEEDLAEESYREARTVLTEMKMSRDVARLWRQLGDSLRRIGDQPGALHAYDASLTLAGMPRTPEPSRLRVIAA